MVNKDFIAELSQRLGYSPTETQKLMNTFADTLTTSLQEENAVTIEGFGTFGVKKKMERIVENPTTKKRMLMPPKIVLTFRDASQTRNNTNR